MNLTPTRCRGSRRVLVVRGALILGLAAFAWAGWPRTASLRHFDPDRMAALETRMWRAYYEKRRLALALDLYRMSREQYRFSPWDSFWLALDAAQAARAFQPSTDRATAGRALPSLTRYFGRMQAGTGETFDPREAAERELDWWQLRREQKSWEEYAPAVARVTTIIYGLSEAEALTAARLRAEMMARRDAKRDRPLTDPEWSEIEAGLVRAWRDLKARVDVRPAPRPPSGK